MNITNYDSRSNPKNNAVDMTISNAGMVVTVAAGTAKIGRQDFVLGEDFEVTLVPDATHDVYAMFYLAKLKSDGSSVVLVDELVADPVNPPITYDFEDPACPYDRLHQLAQVKVVPGATDLDTADAQVWRIVAPPEE